MTPAELKESQCFVCQGEATEWIEFYVCHHTADGVIGSLLRKTPLCKGCRLITVGKSITELVEGKPS